MTKMKAKPCRPDSPPWLHAGRCGPADCRRIPREPLVRRTPDFGALACTGHSVSAQLAAAVPGLVQTARMDQHDGKTLMSKP
ncbi:hypothetical protein, partial [Plasticicumulans sp.]